MLQRSWLKAFIYNSSRNKGPKAQQAKRFTQSKKIQWFFFVATKQILC